MKKESTASRLNKLMSERNLRQVDILELVKPFCLKYGIKMNKSDLSQYVSGKVEPSQEKLVVLGMGLNVSEAWLMGFDVPRERSGDPAEEKRPKIMQYYESLNDLGKHEATKRVRELTELPRYAGEEIRYVNAAHADDYANAPEELKRLEEDMMDDDDF